MLSSLFHMAAMSDDLERQVTEPASLKRAYVPAARWPRGQSRIPLAFNPDWKAGSCLYLPCDRHSIEGHDGWHSQHPALLWEPAKGICKYLGIVHQLLNTNDHGRRLAAVT
jgi:hypothetical protein